VVVAAVNGGRERDQRLVEADPELILSLALADYDRRRATRWGRFLLWLLRRTT
jgi:hypothetical protein